MQTSWKEGGLAGLIDLWQMFVRLKATTESYAQSVLQPVRTVHMDIARVKKIAPPSSTFMKLCEWPGATTADSAVHETGFERVSRSLQVAI